MAQKPLGIGDKYDELVIDKSGFIQLRQHGYEGNDCQVASKRLETKLGTVKGRRRRDDGEGGGEHQTIG